MHHLVTTTNAPARLAQLAALADDAWQLHHSLPEYRPTPLHSLPALAADLGVASLQLKDESTRLGLQSFKGLGVSFAVDRWIRDHPYRHNLTLVTATDGNHGRSVAWAARRLGANAVVFLPGHAEPDRIVAIEGEGAEVILVREGYEAAVSQAHAAADEEGWILVQDSAAPGYVTIPEWIMAGYWTMARELEPSPNTPERPEYDLILLHAGVGTWPAAMTAYYWHRYGERARPRIAVVEPVTAPCVQAAALTGRPVRVDSSRRTIMAGLDCAVASPSAVSILHQSVDAFFTINDRMARAAMRRLATPRDGDPQVISGEAGSASVAGLMTLASDPELAPVREHLALNDSTRVLVWSTEGATDPTAWAAIVGSAPPG